MQIVLCFEKLCHACDHKYMAMCGSLTAPHLQQRNISRVSRGGMKVHRPHALGNNLTDALATPLAALLPNLRSLAQLDLRCTCSRWSLSALWFGRGHSRMDFVAVCMRRVTFFDISESAIMTFFLTFTDVLVCHGQLMMVRCDTVIPTQTIVSAGRARRWSKNQSARA